MRIRWAGILRLSALVAMGGALSFAVFFSNCGGSSGMRAGTAGNNGTAGATAGTTGSGGAGGTSAGTAGVTGSGGTGGRFTCAATQDLTCGGGALMLTGGHVTTFDMQEWSPTDGKWCNASGLRGSIFSYSGGPTVDGAVISSNAQGVDAPNGNFRLTLTAGPGGYAGGGVSFDRCVDVSSFNALRFTAYIASGDLTNCNFKSQLQTFEQRPNSQSPPGGCDPDAGSCYNFPTTMLTLTTTPTPFTLPFSGFASSATQTNPAPGQIVGLQWQLESGMLPDDAGQPTCTAEIRIDDIDFVTQ
jgi:hypothetical protein